MSLQVKTKRGAVSKVNNFQISKFCTLYIVKQISELLGMNIGPAC